MAQNIETFSYPQIDLDDPHAFRLLDLLPGDDDDPVHCGLRHARRGDGDGSLGVRYHAVSYNWGENLFTETIFLNQFLFHVTKNAYSALRGLKNRSKMVTLWMDAICINQTDVPEKNQQVQAMQNVCAEAETVIIWLGEASADSDKAIAFMKMLCAQLQGAGVLTWLLSIDPRLYSERYFTPIIQNLFTPAFDEDWEAVGRLFRRPWWDRAWVVQELISVRTAEFRCGRASISWPALSMMIPLLVKSSLSITQVDHPFRVSGGMDRANAMFIIAQDFATKGHIDFLRLAGQRRRQCSEPRDRVYSMLGLTNEFTRGRLRPDYGKPVTDVWAQALACDIEEHQDLEILTLVDHITQPAAYPSWVANLGRTPVTWRFYKYVPPPPAYKWSEASQIRVSADYMSLSIDGFRIDVVEDAQVQGTDKPFRRCDESQDKWTWDLDQIITVLASDGPLRTANNLLAFDSPESLRRLVERVLYDAIIAGQLSTAMGWNKHEILYAGEQERTAPATKSEHNKAQHEGSRTKPQLIYPMPRFIGLAPTGSLKASSSEEIHPRPGEESKPLGWKNILHQAANQTLGRSLLLTKERYLGIGPVITQPGDCLFVLFGLREAAVLRPQANGLYMFVGTAYFHAFMQGQNLEDFERGKYVSERVTLIQEIHVPGSSYIQTSYQYITISQEGDGTV